MLIEAKPWGTIYLKPTLHGMADDKKVHSVFATRSDRWCLAEDWDWSGRMATVSISEIY